MVSIACFLAIGVVFGFLAPLPLFAAFSIAALIAYAVFATGLSGFGRLYDVVFAAVALQVGYFLAVLIHSVSARKRNEIGTAAETQSEHEIMREFRIGQYVYYVPHNRPRAEGRYVVMRLMPQPNGEPRYIIRSQAEPEREYTVEASELRRVPGGR